MWGYTDGEQPRYGCCRFCGDFVLRLDRHDLVVEHFKQCPGVRAALNLADLDDALRGEVVDASLTAA